MLRLSYHRKQKLKKWGIALGVLAVLLAILWFLWMIWLQRFLVFTRDGVEVRFDQSTNWLDDKNHRIPETETLGVELFINDGEDAVTPSGEGLEKLNGVYADTEMLLDDLDGVKAALLELEPNVPVMLDVKSKYGNFYYTSSIHGASQSESISAEEVDELISSLNKRGTYLIARLPAFRDSAFAEANQSSGLALSSGVLWTDDDKCYWLDPASDAVQSHLLLICKELRELGFDEVVFTDFKIPDSGNIAYNSDTPKEQTIKESAQYFSRNLTSDSFTVSFGGNTSFPLPKGKSRLYLEGVEPEMVESVMAAAPGENPEVQTVLLAQTGDTRYDACSVLRGIR